MFPWTLLSKQFQQNTIFHNCSGRRSSSSTEMAAVVIAIANKHTFRVKEKSILTSRSVFANQLLKIGIYNGKNDSTGCMREGREEFALILSFFSNIVFCSDKGLF